jgi:alkanesulfonate monooxygenase SsuD/methylene tetrahydromethanopterin reductase-like flavin-dependent oxidoreductase (luciferase family)
VKFSLHYTLQSKGSWEREYRDYLKEVKEAEKLGFSAVYVGEHHFSEDGWSPAPFLALSAAASITKRVKLGTNIIVLALHNPFEIAEQTAVLDVISGGRAILGVGLGYRPEEFVAFGVDIKQRAKVYEEKLKNVKALLEGEAVQVDGFKLRVYPRPVQSPRPPVWIAAKSEEAVRKAARRGDAWIMDPVTDINVLKKRMQAYIEELKKAGKSVRDFPLRREVFISEKDEEIEKAKHLMLESYKEDYYAWGHLQDSYGNEIDPHKVSYDEIKDQVLSRMIIGKPDFAIKEIEKYERELGATELMIKLSFPGIDHQMRMNVIRTIASKVMPHFLND